MRVRATPAQLLGRPDLRRLERPELDAVRPTRSTATASEKLDRRLALRRSPRSRDQVAPLVVGHHGHPDLLPGPARAQPGVPRRQRPAGLHPVPVALTSPPTAPSCRPPRWGRAPSTPWCPTTPPPPPPQLRQCHRPRQPVDPVAGRRPLGQPSEARYLQLPHPYPRVAALAASITAGIGSPGDPDPHTYDKVDGHRAVDGRPTSTTPPTSRPWPPGPTPSTSFLFGSRRGYCEQISTATVVMLRTLGIPAREAVGYVPGLLQPDHRPLRRPGQGRPRLGAGLVPRLRLAELRPHGRRAAGQPAPGLGAGPQRRAAPWPTCRGSPSASVVAVVVVVVVVRRRRRRRARPPGPTRWPPTSSGAGPASGAAPAARRDADRLRRSGWPPATPAARRRAAAAPPRWWSAPPTAASSRRPTRSPPPWPSPAASGWPGGDRAAPAGSPLRTGRGPAPRRTRPRRPAAGR